MLYPVELRGRKQAQSSDSLYPLIYRRAQPFVEGLLLSARALPAGQPPRRAVDQSGRAARADPIPSKGRLSLRGGPWTCWKSSVSGSCRSCGSHSLSSQRDRARCSRRARTFLPQLRMLMLYPLSYAATFGNCNALAALSMAKLDPTRSNSAMISVVASMTLLVGLIATAIVTD